VIHVTTKAPAHPCLLQHYSQFPSYENSQDAPLSMYRLRKRGIYTTMEFYSDTKKSEILSFTGKWMELENIILSELIQAQKAKNHVFSFIC
jgi:hypothetical protein